MSRPFLHKALFLSASLCLFANHATATNYYVDFDHGSDNASGQSISAPWKHAPGDKNATLVPASAALQPGDNVIFKAGVVYRGTLTLPASGTAQAPIKYEGSGWGSGQAILSGQDVTELTFKPYADNPDLSVVDLPGVVNFSDIVTIDGTRMWLSTYPASTDPYWIDDQAVTYNPAEMVGSGTTWTFTDAAINKTFGAVFTPDTVTDVIFRAWSQPNVMENLRVTAYNAQTGSFSLQGKLIPYPADKYPGRYHLFNHPAFIAQANQYALQKAGHQLIAPVNAGAHVVEITTRGYGINLNGRSFVTIDGFTITGYAGDDTTTRGGIAIADYGNAAVREGIAITNNKIVDVASWYTSAAIGFNKARNVLIANNQLGPTFMGRGIGIGLSQNLVIQNNTFNKLGRTGVFIANDDHVTFRYNRLIDLKGTHSDGIAVYDIAGGHNTNIDVVNNQFTNVVFPVTYEGNNNPDPATPNKISVVNNVITGAHSGITNWGGGTIGTTIYGNIALTENYIGIELHKSQVGVVVAHNISDEIAMAGAASNWVVTANTLTEKSSYLSKFVTAGNTYNVDLRPTVVNSLAHPGALPVSLCNIIAPGNTAVRIGIDYTCNVATQPHPVILPPGKIVGPINTSPGSANW